MNMSPQELVVDATERLFNGKDLSAVDDLFGPVYVQHSALGPDGTDGLKGLVAGLPPTSGYALIRVLADGDLVVTEGVFQGFAPVPLTGYDVWRVSDGRIVEHWDALGPDGTRAQNDAEPAESAPVDANRELVTEWVRTVLIAGDRSAVDRFATSDALVPDNVTYLALHAVIADGDLVYTRSEGDRDGAVIVNDVWRVDGGTIVERWGLVTPVPATLPHSNGAF